MQHDVVSSTQNHHGAGPIKENLSKRRPRRGKPNNGLPGQVAFRIVCHVSAVDGIIGNCGAILSQLHSENAAEIHCEEAVPGSDHRVILIVGSGSIDRRIMLDSKSGNRYNESGESVECDVSSAQELMIRVFERLWAVEAEIDHGGGKEEEAYCGLLADTTQIGAVVGRGGKNIVRMRRETGAKIRILPPPHWAAKDDELIQIAGGSLAVKKALVAVSGCLKDFPPLHRNITSLTRAVDKAHHGPSTDQHAEFFPHLSSFLPNLNGNYTNTASLNAHLPSTSAEENPRVDMKATKKEVVFKMLCSNRAAGGIIGKRGAIVRALENETGASIVVAPPLTRSGERIVTISAFENLDSRHSPAQNAVVLVFARSIESDIEKGFPSGLGKGTTVMARLLAASDLVSSLTGEGRRTLSNMIDITGSDIRILGHNQVLDCASENEVVIQITGEYKNVQNTLFHVTAGLRDNLLPSKVLNEVRARNPYERVRENNPALHQSLSKGPNANQNRVLTRKVERGISEQTDCSFSPKLQPSQTSGRGHRLSVTDSQSSKKFGGSREVERSLDFLLPPEVLNEVGVRETTSPGFPQSSGLFVDSDRQDTLTQGMDELGLSNKIGFSSSQRLQRSTKKSAMVRNTTVEIIVAENVFGSVYGKDGINLACLRQISGAKVEVHDPAPGKSEGMVIVSGTPDQTQKAQSLLHAFIGAGQ